jgi:hypothetical protein
MKNCYCYFCENFKAKIPIEEKRNKESIYFLAIFHTQSSKFADKVFVTEHLGSWSAIKHCLPYLGGDLFKVTVFELPLDHAPKLNMKARDWNKEMTLNEYMDKDYRVPPDKFLCLP